MPTEEIKIKLADLELAALCWGEPQLPVIIALHGWLDNAASFSHLAPLLTGYRVIALDLAGHGHSSYLVKDKQYRLVDVAQYIVQALAQLQLPSVTLLGHSLGGALASYIAANFPMRVHQLIMIDAMGPLSAEAIKLTERLQTTMQDFVTTEQRPAKCYASFATMLKLRAKINGLSEQQAVALVERAVVKREDGYYWRFDPKLRSPSLTYFTEAQVLTMLNNIAVPTLVIEAAKGILANIEVAKKRRQAFRDIMIKQLPGGHHLHLSHPQQVATAIMDFLLGQLGGSIN